MSGTRAGSTAVVFDESALLALGSGNSLASQFISNTEHGPTRHVYVPALCLAAADGRRKGLAEQVGALPAAEIVELDLAGASTVGALLREELSGGSVTRSICPARRRTGRTDATSSPPTPICTRICPSYAPSGCRGM